MVGNSVLGQCYFRSQIIDYQDKIIEKFALLLLSTKFIVEKFVTTKLAVDICAGV